MNKIIWVLAAFAAAANGEVRTEQFDSDPGWDGLNNRPPASSTRTVQQDFGYDRGVIGGQITPDGSPAYYAKEIARLDFITPFSASGTLRVEKGAGNTLFGFFNSDTINEWRTPNTVVFRINGRGDVFHVHVEYATSKWRAGAGVIGRYDTAADRMYPIEIPGDTVHKWSLAYDPAANDGLGAVVATFDDQRAVCNLAPGHKADGATFNRFGLLNVVKSVDSPGKLWIGDLTINGESQDLSRDPGWEGLRNRITYESEEVRPRFNFGFSPTNYAKGRAPGEMGGLFFRGDCRYPERLAYYGARLDTLTLEKFLHASGKLVLRRAVSDSTTLLGFFHSKHSVEVNPSQANGMPMDILGFCIEGPSAQGFFVYPVYRVHGDGQSNGIAPGARLIYPDGVSHDWSLDYRPPAEAGAGTIALTVDDTSVEIPVDPRHLAEGATFDRFGLVTPWIDGNGQVVYFDDLAFTDRQ